MPPLVIAHRGGAGLHPENSLAALRHSVELGVDGIEVDVHPTADGVPVCIHDPELDRTTDGSGPVVEHDLGAIRSLHVVDGDGTVTPESPPTLAEALETVGDGATLQVELKEGLDEPYPDLVDAVLGVVREAGALERTVFISFSRPYLTGLRARNLPVPVVPLATGEAIDERFGGPEPFLDLVRAGGFEAVGVEKVAVDAEFVARAGERGIEVGVWTVDDPREMRRLIDLDVASITSDRPDRLLEVLGRA